MGHLSQIEIHDVQPQAETKRPLLTTGGVIIVLGSGNGYFFIRGFGASSAERWMGESAALRQETGHQILRQA